MSAFTTYTDAAERYASSLRNEDAATLNEYAVLYPTVAEFPVSGDMLSIITLTEPSTRRGAVTRRLQRARLLAMSEGCIG